MSDLTIIIPAYNEQDTLPLIIQDWFSYCEKEDARLIVVDDGSSDQTGAFLDAIPAKNYLTIIHHKINKGYGAAIKTGIRNSETKYLVTIDADGQHTTESVKELHALMLKTDSDLIIGARKKGKGAGFRNLGKTMIRGLSRILLPNKITDLNSGLKIYQTELAKKFIAVCPNSMAFSDIITLTFIAERCKVMELPISVNPRMGGKSKINLNTAFETIFEIINIVIFFNPLRIFLPISVVFFLLGLGWGLPIALRGRGVSVGSLLAFTIAGISFLLGLIAEQLSQIRKMLIEK
jgi:glycosyltransferase involved in cell wall biosynthesis